MSCLNGILRRPHIPRGLEIRALIKDLGLKLPPKKTFTESDEEDPEEEEEDWMEEEQCESELETDDEDVPCCLSFLGVVSIFSFSISSDFFTPSPSDA